MWAITAAAAAAKSHQSCPTLQDPIDGSPPGPGPWDSPGKNTGVGCHFLLQCMKVKSESEVTQSCPTLCDPTDGSPPGSTVPGILSPGKNTGVGCHSLLPFVKVKSESEAAQSCPTLSDPMDCAYQAPLSMGFSRQEYWSGVSLPSLMILCNG